MVIKKKDLLAVMITGVFAFNSYAGTAFAYDKTDTVYLSGNSHIDTGWYWDSSTTVNEYIPTTFNQAVNLMNANSDYTFNASSALHHLWAKQIYPDTYNGIKSKVANGQWNLVGGQWIQPDLNIPSGESIVRQSLFGQKFFQKEFGVKCKVGWMPDTFGYSGQVPQILKKSGMDYFVTSKLNWNDTNKFGKEIFNWNGIDGSSLIAYKPRANYDTSIDQQADIKYVLDEPAKHEIKKGLLLYGQGDRGGGPTQTQIDKIRSYDSDTNMPSVKMVDANDFFDSLTEAEKTKITDKVDGEMYAEFHRGTYTSQAKIKKNNRLGETYAEEAEKFSSIANLLGEVAYPQSIINNSWEKILQNQFHDTISGAGGTTLIREAHANGDAAIGSLNYVVDNATAGIARRADTTGNGVPLIVYNALSFGRKQPVETTVTFDSEPSSVRIYDNGTEIPSQVLDISGNTAKVVFIVDIDPVGFKVVHAIANTGNYSGTGLTAESNAIENKFYRVELDAKTGNMKRIYNKENSMEVLAGDGNRLRIMEDTPKNWDAWDVDYDDMTADPIAILDSTTGIGLVENGPVKSTYCVNKKYGKSMFMQFITLYKDIDRIDIKMLANWNETHKMLKVEFPWNLRYNIYGPESVNYEIGYGTQNRSNTRTTDFNKARFEVPAQKWADISSMGYGVSLLNDCKYGYETVNHTMRLSLLRSPTYPDPTCDKGYHEFTYSIYPHSGDFRSANTVFRGYELNYPLTAYQTTNHTGDLGKAKSFMSVDAPNVILSVLKKAEDSNDYIVRMYETQGAKMTDAKITLPAQIKSLDETNLLEESIGSQSFSGNTFKTSLGKYEIKTFKVNLGSTQSVNPQKNLSGFKTTEASSFVSGQDPKYAVDNTTATKWCATNPGDKWLKIDLGSEVSINRWLVMHATAGGEDTVLNTRDFKLQSSLDGVNWQDVDVVINNDEGVTDRRIKPCIAKYVRLYITQAELNGNEAARIYEFEVYGENAALFYQHKDYGGKGSGYLYEGDYNLEALKKKGFLDSWASSVHIPFGYTVQVFDDEELKSTSLGSNQWLLTKNSAGGKDFSTLSNNANDRVSSVRVRNGVAFYKNNNYTGYCTRGMGVGKYTLAELQKYGFVDNQASSVSIPDGWYVKLYENDNFEGTQWKLTTEDNNSRDFVNFGGNDKVSSVEVGIENSSLIP